MCDMKSNYCMSLKMFRTNINMKSITNKLFLPNDGRQIKEAPFLGLKGMLIYSKVKFAKPLLLATGALYMFSFGYCTYGKTFIKDSTGIVHISDHVAHFLLTLANLSTISTCFRYNRHSETLWKLFRFIYSCKQTKNKFRILGIAVSITCLIAAGCDTYFWAAYQGWKSMQYYILRDLQFIIMNFTLYSIVEAAYYLKVMFSDVNKQLLEVYSEYIKFGQHASNVMQHCKIIHVYKPTQRLSMITRITTHHNQLCIIVDDFNAVFGLVLFAVAFNLVSNVVWPLTMIAAINIPKLTNSTDDLHIPIACNISHLTMNMLWVGLMIGHAVLIGSIGGSLTAEGHLTSTYCYKILHQQKLTEKGREETRIKFLLTSLVKQAETRCPVLSADGFFIINLSILGMVASNVFAYTIVIVQFIYNNNASSKVKL